MGIGRFYENKRMCNCNLTKIKYIFVEYNLFHATLFYTMLLSILHCLLLYAVSRSTLGLLLDFPDLHSSVCPSTLLWGSLIPQFPYALSLSLSLSLTFTLTVTVWPAINLKLRQVRFRRPLLQACGPSVAQA